MTGESHYSIVEIEEQVAGLSDADIARFIQYFELRGCIRRLGWSGLEHFHHTIADVLEGRRAWPRDVPRSAFLWNAGRSILSNEAKKKEREVEAQHVDVDECHEKEALQNDHVGSLDESSYIANSLETQQGQELVKQWYSQITDLFDDDHVVMCIIQQKYNELKKSVILKVCNINEMAYQAAMKKMKYHLKKAFPGGLPWWEVEP